MKQTPSTAGLGDRLRRLNKQHLALLIAATALALLIRISLLGFVSKDFLSHGRVWYYQLQDIGFRAFRHRFVNGNLPYLYLLWLTARFLPGLANLTAIKLPSIVGDFICAGFVYQIARRRRGSRSEALLAYTVVLFAPAILLDGSFWGQADSLCAAGIAACLYGVLKRQSWITTISFGIALVFGLPAIFLLPLLLGLSLRKRLAARHWLAIPGVLVAVLLPAWAVGRPISSLVRIYGVTGPVSGALSTYAPNVYAWLPVIPELASAEFWTGLVLTLSMMGALVAAMARSRAELSETLVVHLATLCAMIVPFMAPGMRERFFLPADVLSIVLAFYAPEMSYVAVIVNMCSFFSYVSSLFAVIYHRDPFPQAWLAIALLISLVLLAHRAARHLRPHLPVGGPGPAMGDSVASRTVR
jgi:Gpi18-like mannosyltransferase